MHMQKGDDSCCVLYRESSIGVCLLVGDIDNGPYGDAGRDTV